MEKLKIPVLFFNQDRALFFGRKFRALGAVVLKGSPDIKTRLVEAAMDIDPLDYVSTGIFTAIILAIMMSSMAGLLFVAAIVRGVLNPPLTLILLFMAVGLPSIFLLYFINYPQLQITKRKRQADEKLVFAIRELVIKVGSGVPIFNSLLDISNGDYGLLSEEFRLTVEEIQAGANQETALRNLSKRMPSQSFRRAIDILINAMRAGSDLSGTLALINDMLVKKQQADMAAYASELTPLSLAYMLISVVLPSLGMSVFLVLGSVAKFNVLIVVYLIPMFLIIFQIFFMGLVRSRRPAISA